MPDNMSIYDGPLKLILTRFYSMLLQISVLMRQRMQHHNGKFVIPIDGPIPVGFEIPGTIR